jgi:hypothetical protein
MKIILSNIRTIVHAKVRVKATIITTMTSKGIIMTSRTIIIMASRAIINKSVSLFCDYVEDTYYL